MAANTAMIAGGTPLASQPASPNGSLFRGGLSPLPMGLDAQVSASLRAAEPIGDTWETW